MQRVVCGVKAFIFLILAHNLYAQNPVGVSTPVLHPKHGFFNSPVDVSIQTSAINAQILYTTDGSEPNEQNHKVYADFIHLEKTTVLRARIKNSENKLDPVTTQTYIFPDDVINQTNSPPGYPATWGPYTAIAGFAIADYEMDPEITQDIKYASKIKESLLSLPTVSLVTNKNNLFGQENNAQTGGVYIYTGAPGNGEVPVAGKDWERPVSMEFFNSPDQLDFQINCGMELHGGHSRRPEKSPKHSFRIKFKTEYGPSKLEHRVFGDTAATNFNSLVLSAGFGNTIVHWQHSERTRMQLTRDSWAKDTQLFMGHPAGHGRFVHLYLNGLYWGIYNLMEHLNEDFAESYLGGSDNDFDIIKDYAEVVAGNGAAWNTLLQLASADLTNNTNYFKLLGKNSDGSTSVNLPALIDPESLADYMILNFYGGNTDWDHHNWIAIRNQNLSDKGFKFFAWDSEHILKNLSDNTLPENNPGRPSYLFRQMIKNTTFQELFRNRIQMHCFNGGALTVQATTNRLTKRSSEIESAIVAEAARWGDYRRDVHPYATDGPFILYTPEVWQKENQYLLTTYFPQRTQIFIQQLKSAGLFQNTQAPEVLINGKEIYSNRIRSGDLLTFVASQGTIYYSLNGEDPILGNGISYTKEITLQQSALLKARVLKDTQWSALTEILFFNPVELSNLRVTEIQYHPLPDGVFSSNDLEYIELKNTGNTPLDLSYLKLDSGIHYNFANKTFIQPGQFIVLASHAVGFKKRYGFSPWAEFQGQLGNDGDVIAIKSNTQTIANISYSNLLPWPVEADGRGYSVVPININPSGDQSNPTSWRSSLYSGGSPGSDDVLITSVEDTQIPCRLYQNFPNPFDRTTNLSYTLTTSGLVKLKVFDMVGQELEILVNENQPAGNYNLSFTPANISSGLLILRLWVNGESVAVKKMVKIE